MKRVHKYWNFRTGYTLDKWVREFYQLMLDCGLTCEQSLDSQLHPGVIPTFTFMHPTGRGFVFGKSVKYEDSDAGMWKISLTDVPIVSGWFRTNQVGVSMTTVIDGRDGNNGECTIDVVWDNHNFFLQFGDLYHVSGRDYPGKCYGASIGIFTTTSGDVLSSCNSDADSPEGWQDAFPPYLETQRDYAVYYDRDCQPCRKAIRLPRPTDGYTTLCDYLLSSRGQLIEGNALSELSISSYTLKDVVNCSFVPPQAKIRIGSVFYYSLDSYTLVKLD